MRHLVYVYCGVGTYDHDHGDDDDDDKSRIIIRAKLGFEPTISDTWQLMEET